MLKVDELAKKPEFETLQVHAGQVELPYGLIVGQKYYSRICDNPYPSGVVKPYRIRQVMGLHRKAIS